MWTIRVCRNPEPNSFNVSLSAQNWCWQIERTSSLHWVHLLCGNDFNRLPSRNSAITIAWVMRQSSDNEKLKKQRKTCMFQYSKTWNVQPSLFSIWSSGRPVTKVIRLTKKSQNYGYHLRDLAGLSHCPRKTSSSSTPTFLINQTPVRNSLPWVV